MSKDFPASLFKSLRLALFTAILLSAGLCRASGGGEVLWWLVDTDYESITADAGDGTTVTAGQLGVTDARLRYQSDDGLSSGYLSFFSINDDGSVTVLDGSGNLGGAHGVGLPAEYFADLSELSGTAYSFVLELGNWENGKWARTSMESEQVSYYTLAANKHISSWAEEAPSYGTPWTPGGFQVVPEPSSGLMILLGVMALGLRRKRGGTI